MTYTEAFQYMVSLKPGGMKWGLGRMERILAYFGNPQRRLRVVHVAGTNGKGSVARMIQSVLTAAGYRTGLYSSPAVTGLRDTITIDNTAIPEVDFAVLTERIRPFNTEEKMEEAGCLSEFELITALAFLYFAAQHTDICVIECGLGGRDDATNCIPAPLAAVITPVSLDHTAILGKTVEEIARHKCGIIKPPCSVITSPAQDGEALAVILQTAAESGLTVHIPATGSAPIRTLALGRTEFDYGGLPVSLPLTGTFQRDNALTAIETVRILASAGFPVTDEQIQAGLRLAAMPCRQEVLRQDPLVLIDGGHNPQGVAALADTLRTQNAYGFTLITGMLADKDTDRCMALLAPFCRRAVCCTPDNPRALPAEELAEKLRKAAPELSVDAVDDPAAALTLARRDKSRPLLVAGSFYIASVLRPLLLTRQF